MLLPAILAPEGAPHHLRLIGTIVPTYIFVALGFAAIVGLVDWFMSRVRSPWQWAQAGRVYVGRIGFFVAVACFGLVAGQTYGSYFFLWPLSVDFTLPFDLYAVRLAASISRAPEDTAYIIPMDVRAADEARHYTLDYLLAPSQPAYSYIPVDEDNAAALLTRVAVGKDKFRVIRWRGDKHLEADAKEIVTYLLETTALPVGRESFPVYDVETYALEYTAGADCATGAHGSGAADCNAHPPTFELPRLNKPSQSIFDGLISLKAAYVEAEIDASSRWLPVAVTLAPVAAMDADYKASVRLLSPGGERLAQKDRVLAHNFHQGTSLWPAEPVNEYYLLPLPPGLLPGEYTVALVIYHPDTLAALTADGVVEVPLGTVRIR